MKKAIALLIIMMGSLMAKAQSAPVWDDWQQTSCYSKISYRFKDEGIYGERHLFKVQFKSSYTTTISFNYKVTDKVSNYDPTTHRKVLNAGEVSGEMDIYNDSDDIFLLVDKVSLSPYPQNFIDCDKK